MTADSKKIIKNKRLKITDILASDAIRNRLFQAGFIPGTLISLINQMPFSGALIFKLRGTKFALRNEDAACLRVEYA